jgi:hypothetical protein
VVKKPDTSATVRLKPDTTGTRRSRQRTQKRIARNK